jgi:hypothetical protein
MNNLNEVLHEPDDIDLIVLLGYRVGVSEIYGLSAKTGKTCAVGEDSFTFCCRGCFCLAYTQCGHVLDTTPINGCHLLVGERARSSCGYEALCLDRSYRGCEICLLKNYQASQKLLNVVLLIE